VYDPTRATLVTALGSDETLAMIVACSPWAVPSGRARAAQLGLVADDRNPEFRFVLNPITNDEGVVIGAAGMILSERFVRDVLLPETIDDMLEHFFTEASTHFEVIVRDDDRRIVYTTGEGAERLAVGSVEVGEDATIEKNAAVARFPFVFTDWTVELRGKGRSPEELASASFTSNMTLAVLLAAMLLAGIVLSLRVASRAVRLSEMKSDFVSNVSHELRTPVASIRVFGELLRHGRADSPDKVRRYGEHIETESRRLTRLIDNVLDFSRMESGRKEYHFERAHLEHVVESAVDATRVRLREAGFDVRYEAPESELPALDLDPDAIGQVLHNLIDNAVKYSGEARRIDLRVYRENATAVVSVRDEGVGIPRDEQQRIFERFHRVQTSLVHDVQGSGLGLAIVQHVVRAHGGRVDVESERGRGTTVFVRIPLSNGGGESSGRIGDES
jgi:signal transduction histidine kinase